MTHCSMGTIFLVWIIFFLKLMTVIIIWDCLCLCIDSMFFKTTLIHNIGWQKYLLFSWNVCFNDLIEISFHEWMDLFNIFWLRFHDSLNLKYHQGVYRNFSRERFQFFLYGWKIFFWGGGGWNFFTKTH